MPHAYCGPFQRHGDAALVLLLQPNTVYRAGEKDSQVSQILTTGSSRCGAVL
jgi:hypothetical protein